MQHSLEDAISRPLGTLTIIVGLPGAGKTTYMNSLKASNPQVSLYDDYQGVAYDNDPDPQLSKHFGPLVADLKQAKRVVVSDIRYCVPRELNAFLGAILSAVPDVRIEFKYFDNNPEACRRNILARNRETYGRELEKLEKLSVGYIVPTTENISVYDSDAA